MNIAIVSKFDYHFECLGFLLELLSADNNITICYEKELFDYISYFKSLYVFNSDCLKNYKTNPHNYDLTILLTSHDSCMIPEKRDKTIGILHLGGKNLEKDLKYFLTLYPNIKPKTNLEYIYTLPVYRGYKNYEDEKNENMITYVGFFGKDYFDLDLQNFIRSANYTFKFIIYGYNAKVLEEMKTFPNIIQINQGINATELIKIVRKSKFLLCRKWPFQKDNIFSGMISLGLSQNVPLIMHNHINKANIPCLSFNKTYSSISEDINNISDEEYNDLKKEMYIFCETIIEENKIKMMDFFSKINGN